MKMPGRLLVLLSFITLLFNGCTGMQSEKSSGLKSGDKARILKVGVAVNSPPFAFRSDGQIQGLEIDLATQIAAFLGRRLEVVEISWEKLIPALEENKVDVVMSGMTVTQSRLYRVAFTKPYMRSGQMLLVRSSDLRRFSDGIYSLMGTKPTIGLVKNTTGDFFITKNIHGASIVRFSTSADAVKALVKEKIDVVVHDAPIVRYYSAVNETQKLITIPQMATEEYLAWAVAESNVELLQSLNSFVEVKAADGTLRKTIERWLRVGR